MKRQYCVTCKTDRPHTRRLGIGTLLAIVLTAGVWLLLLPVYKSRCAACGTPDDRVVVPWH